MRVKLAWWWYDSETRKYGIEMAPTDNPEKVLSALIWQVEGLKPTDLTKEEIDALVRGLYYQQMQSVVKADWDEIGDDLLFHTEGSGKRIKQAWWMDRDLMDRVCERASIEVGYAS